MIPWSALFELLQALDFPHAAFRAAGLALKPRLRWTTHVARQEVAAGERAFIIGSSKRRDVTAGPGVRILPRDAGYPCCRVRARLSRRRAHRRGRLPKVRRPGSNCRPVPRTRFAPPPRRPFRTSCRAAASSRQQLIAPSTANAAASRRRTANVGATARFHYIEAVGPLSRSPLATQLGNPNRKCPTPPR